MIRDMETPAEHVVNTVAGATYAFTVCEAPTTAYAQSRSGKRTIINHFNEEKAYRFDALTDLTVFSGGKIAQLERIYTSERSSSPNANYTPNADGEPVYTSEKSPSLTLSVKHNCWHYVDSSTTTVRISAAGHNDSVQTMQLLLTPAESLNSEWLTADNAELRWPYGEPAVVAGFAYVVTLVQLPLGNDTLIIANLTPLGAL